MPQPKFPQRQHSESQDLSVFIDFDCGRESRLAENPKLVFGKALPVDVGA